MNIGSKFLEKVDSVFYQPSFTTFTLKEACSAERILRDKFIEVQSGTM